MKHLMTLALLTACGTSPRESTELAAPLTAPTDPAQGPAGVAGATGATGATGQAGPAGVAGPAKEPQ